MIHIIREKAFLLQCFFDLRMVCGELVPILFPFPSNPKCSYDVLRAEIQNKTSFYLEPKQR